MTHRSKTRKRRRQKIWGGGSELILIIPEPRRFLKQLRRPVTRNTEEIDWLTLRRRDLSCRIGESRPRTFQTRGRGRRGRGETLPPALSPLRRSLRRSLRRGFRRRTPKRVRNPRPGEKRPCLRPMSSLERVLSISTREQRAEVRVRTRITETARTTDMEILTSRTLMRMMFEIH